MWGYFCDKTLQLIIEPVFALFICKLYWSVRHNDGELAMLVSESSCEESFVYWLPADKRRSQALAHSQSYSI